jgi:Ca-activated chloride channel family protein
VNLRNNRIFVWTLGLGLSNAQEGIPVFKADAQLVVLHASVVDKSGKPITIIPQSAFKIYENDANQPLKGFRREDVPVSMGIIIDKSGSMRDKRDRVAAAALALVRASNPQDEVFIVHFNDVARMDQPFTSDIKKLERALAGVDSIGNTALRDAISMSINYAKQNGKQDKKVLLVVTDGNDTASNEGLKQLVYSARQSEVLIYCIGLLNQEEPRATKAAKHELRALAEASGGQDYYPKDVAEIEKITPRIASEIRSQYMLTYSPLNPALDGTFRRIRVAVTGFGRATVRTRNGYFATPTPSPKANIPASSSGPRPPIR